MGNPIDLPNITPESIEFGNDNNSTRPSSNGFNSKNYLNVRLDEGEDEKTITIRLLPMDLTTGNPFAKIHVHNVEVPKELVKKGQKPYKDYICVARTADVDHETFGNKCPFCEINKRAYDESTKTTDPVIKKNWQDISIANLHREAVIVRCIERGKENEGVKFWKFKTRSDKTDPYNQIIKLYNLRKAEGEKAGVPINILDIYNGRDLNVTITKEGTSAPQILDVSVSTPLSKDEEQMRAWIYDKKKWQDVFTCKPYEYLKLVSEMRIPWYDKDKGIWVDQEEYNKEHGITQNTKQAVNDANAEIEAAQKQLAQEAAAASAPAPAPAPAPVPAPAPTATPTPAASTTQPFAASITIQEDDLPF